MKIKLHEITIREVVEKYVDNDEEGVIGFDGKLNIRPKYQREFVYDDRKRSAVIETIRKDFPLNVMYWCKNEDGTFEVLDGQQRTISFCQFIKSDFSIMADGHTKYFHTMTETEKNHILNYKLFVYICEGNDKEKLDWFQIINIAGEKLTDQELRNAVYTGTWLSDAKLKFSKSNCVAYLHSKDYVSGATIRQEILELALLWISKGNIEKYMSAHQHDPNANELWTYFRSVIDWARLTFPKTRKEMKGINWGGLYDTFKDKMFDTNKLEQEIQKLMIDDDVTNQKGVYYYVLTRDEKYLNIRAFSESQRRTAFEKQEGICAKCKKQFQLNQMEADHITPWSKGGKTSNDNCQMLCQECNRRKSAI
ncbi:MAG: DUF262 domain-containing protein [Christensenellaceae bacterium]|jgi:hypothetical protein|nr:DUF262 domain-containing protein [Christensenellaceae bacterium]